MRVGEFLWNFDNGLGYNSRDFSSCDIGCGDFIFYFTGCVFGWLFIYVRCILSSPPRNTITVSVFDDFLVDIYSKLLRFLVLQFRFFFFLLMLLLLLVLGNLNKESCND